MRFSTAIISTLLGVAATVSAETFTVVVGKDNSLTYDPPTVNAKVGDVISFQFLSKNHTVTQSTFASPCVAMDAGVDSGFQFVPAGAAQIPAWSITINNDTAPLWFFCGRAPHCAEGMVFSVNPTADKTHEAFLANAKAGGGAPPADGAGAPPASGSATVSGSGAPPAITLSPSAPAGVPGPGAAAGAANAASNPNSDPSGTAASQQQDNLAGSAAGVAVKGAGWMAMGVAGAVALLL